MPFQHHVQQVQPKLLLSGLVSQANTAKLMVFPISDMWGVFKVQAAPNQDITFLTPKEEGHHFKSKSIIYTVKQINT